MGKLLRRLAQSIKKFAGSIRVPGGHLGASLLCTAVFFAILLSVFPSGYAINDDLKMIALPAGYPTGHPVPFLIFSNVLLGFVLVALHRLPTDLNWEMLIFIMAQFASVWLLFDEIISSRLSRGRKAFGMTAVMVCEAYFALNLTFTTTAAFAAIAGCCGLVFAARARAESRIWQMVMGSALVVTAALIRVTTVPLMAVLVLPYAVFAHRALNLRQLAVTVVVTGLLVSGSWLFDRLYVRASPAWNQYYFYQYEGALVQDTHRLENLGTTIRRIGWSPNDQELFIRWLYPDYEPYSLDRIRFLVDHVSPVSSSPEITLLSILRAPFAPLLLPYVLCIAAAALWMLFYGEWRRAWLPVLGLWSICLVANAYLAVTWKIADRIFLPTFAATAVLTFLTAAWMEGDPTGVTAERSVLGRGRRWAMYGAIAVLALAVVVQVTQSFRTAAIYREKRVLYRQILSDVATLRQNGTIAPEALILSPAHGLPLEWSTPWLLQLPAVQYFDMGWMSFSPTYDEIMSNHAISQLPEALYEKDDVYLMTRSNILPYVARYYKEHRGVSVSFQSLYAMPNIPGDATYQDVHIYKVMLAQ